MSEQKLATRMLRVLASIGSNAVRMSTSVDMGWR